MIQFYKGVFKSIDLIKFEQYDISCFHSDKYFIVDLKSDYNIEFIKFNTIKDIEVKIFFSSDSIKWVDCYDITNKNLYEFYINTNTQNKYRFIKINIDYCLIKNQLIDIYVRKYPGLMIAARSDGFGARLMPILNAMYLAEYTGFKFGFVWKKVAYDDTSLKQFEDNDLAGIYLSNEKYIFSQEFIDEYSYTDKIESNRGILRNINIEELQTTPFDHVWGWYISQNTSQIVFSNQYEKFAAEYPRLWSKIKFSPRIQEIIKLSNNTAKEAFDNSFIAIHIRSGDIVYDERINSCGIEWHKAMPVEIAMELIEKNKKENKNIVLFGDDLSELRALKQYYHVSIIEDFIQELTGIDRIIFEINFMSKAEVIYSGHSSFARVASYIGLGKEPTFYYKYFGRFQTYTIIKKRINDNRCIVHNLQKSYSYYFLFRLGYAIKKDFQELLDWLRLAWKYNHKNELYALGIVFFSILSNRTQEAEKMICNHSIGEHFLNNFYKQCFFQKIFNNKINVSMITRKRYPNLFCFLNKYYPIFGAIYTHSGTLRVKNHLSYKLGMTFLNNSKTFIDYIKLPFLLFEVTRQHKKEKQEFKTQAKDHNLSPALPPLEECLDYKEVLKIQNGLPYKIGISLIKANKEWYKGGYIKFWYNLYQLKKEFKDKKG